MKKTIALLLSGALLSHTAHSTRPGELPGGNPPPPPPGAAATPAPRLPAAAAAAQPCTIADPDVWYDMGEVIALLTQNLTAENGFFVEELHAGDLFTQVGELASSWFEHALTALQVGQTVALPFFIDHKKHFVTIVMFVHNGVVNIVYYDSQLKEHQTNFEVVDFLNQFTGHDAFVGWMVETGLTLNQFHVVHQQQTNDNDCGAFTVENLIAFANAAQTGALGLLLQEHANQDGELIPIAGEPAVALLGGINVPLPEDKNAQAHRERHAQALGMAPSQSMSIAASTLFLMFTMLNLKSDGFDKK